MELLADDARKCGTDLIFIKPWFSKHDSITSVVEKTDHRPWERSLTDAGGPEVDVLGAGVQLRVALHAVVRHHLQGQPQLPQARAETKEQEKNKQETSIQFQFEKRVILSLSNQYRAANIAKLSTGWYLKRAVC